MVIFSFICFIVIHWLTTPIKVFLKETKENLLDSELDRLEIEYEQIKSNTEQVFQGNLFYEIRCSDDIKIKYNDVITYSK